MDEFFETSQQCASNALEAELSKTFHGLTLKKIIIMLVRALKMSFWVFYDHLGKLLIVNMISAACFLIPLFYALRIFVAGSIHKFVWIVLPIVFLTVAIVIPLVLVGLLWMVKEIIEKREGSLGLFFSGIQLFGARATALGLVYALGSIFLLTSIWFYGVRLGALYPFLGYGLSAVAAWAWLFLILSAMLVLPTLVNKNGGIGVTMKVTAALVIENPLFTAGVAAHALILLAVSIVPPVFVLFSFASLATLQGSAYEILSRKYAAIQSHANETGKIDKTITIDYGDENDEYLCRGFRDLFFPWKE